ncbi:MAG: MFS transporter [Spirulinaceae cyanobacterium]
MTTKNKLSFINKVAYGVGDLGAGVTSTLIVFSLLIFLTDVAGLRPELAATVLLIGKVWDAIMDPIVGMLSDRTRLRWGRRHSWMLFAAIPFGVSFFLYWIVPNFSSDPDTNQWLLFSYYVVIGLIFNTAFTCVNIPYSALTPELTDDYDERTSLNSFRFVFSISGSLFTLAFGELIFQIIPDPQPRFLLIASICACLAIIPTYLCVWGTTDPSVERNQNRQETPTESISLPEQLKIVFSNRPFLFVIGIYLCSWLAFQLTAATIAYYLIYWMRQDSFFIAALVVQAVALVMLLVWTEVSKKVGRRAVYFMGMSLWIVAQGALFFLPRDQIALMYFLFVLAGFGIATVYLVPWSMLPDVTDLDEYRSGKRREGIFYAFMILLQKIGLALGIWLVGQGLSFAGYIEPQGGKQVLEQPESALLVIRLFVGPLPTIFLIGGLILAYFYPLSKEVHADIMLQLQERRNADV